MKKNTNQFADTLEDLLDKTGIFTRQEWAENLFVTTSTLSQWVNGKSSPRPDHLQKVIDFLEQYDTPEVKKPLKRFYEIADRPLKEIMPAVAAAKFKGVSNVSDYLMKVYMPNFQIEMSRLPGQFKREALSFCNGFLQIVDRMASKKGNETFYEDLKKAIGKIQNEKLEPLLKEVIEGESYKGREIRFQPELLDHYDIAELVNHTEIKNKFILEEFDKVIINKDEHRYRFNIVLWTFSSRDSASTTFDEMNVDELLFIKIKGKFKWKFLDEKEVDMVSNSILSVKASGIGEDGQTQFSGLPRSEMIVEEDGFGFAILFRKEGLVLDSFSFMNSLTEAFHFPSTTNESNTNRRNDKQYLSYLKSLVFSHANLSFKTEDLEKYMKENIIRYADDTHQYQRVNAQMKDVFLSSVFKTWEDDDHKILAVKLIKFNQVENIISNIQLSRHYGSEIIIPLSGRLKFISAGTLDGDTIPCIYPIKEIDKSDRREEPVTGMNEYVDGYPNIIVLNGETPHAFIGLDDHTYCLHIRIMKISRERTIEKNMIVEGDNNRITASNTQQTIVDIR